MRTKLRCADHLPYKGLNLGGSSRLEAVDLKTMRTFSSDGDKWATNFCDLYAANPAQKAIHVSRMAHNWTQVGERILSNPCTVVLFKENVVVELRKEVTMLKESLRVLYVPNPAGSNHSLRYGGDGTKRTEDEVRQAVKVIYEWCTSQATASVLRDVVGYMSMGGLTWNCFVFEKAFRAYLAHGGEAMASVPCKDIEDACVARFVQGRGGDDGEAADQQYSALAALGA